MRKKWLVKFTAMLSMAAMLSGIVTFPVSEVVVAEAEETAQTAQNIISNADFSDADTSAWCGMLGNSKITSETSDTPVYDDVKTYGKIDRDPAQSGTYESFAQDITEQVKDANGAVYTYEFYAKLSGDYKDAPEEQRKVEFAPVITADGNANYMGSYSPEITGTASQALEVGKWTKYEGTFTVQWTGKLDQVMIRVIEQGTNYGSGDCVKGDYYLAGFKMIRQFVPKPEIEKDIPSLRDVMATEAGLGSDAVIGTSLTSPEISDETLMDLVEKHFNAVTLGNELKLDCMLGYNNAACPEGSITKAEIDGKEIDVPTLDHSRADKMLDTILAWNEANPQKKIRVRGHVLVWHSQAPEWFFHEGYDKTKAYVSKETMNLRMEWYIKTMLTYYTGADSKYKNLFYGWDVVNEAVSGESYRTDTEPGGDSLTDDTHGSKSSWWKVYGSNEFIINAFTYANKYAPASLELYYNDYGECDSHKMIGISNLLTAVKEKAGAPGTGTRIDGMGMQAHYNLESPTAAQLEAAVRTYAKIVGKVQLTELDFTASNDFDGTDATREQEYVKQAYKYKEVYDTLCRLDKEDGIDVSGFTVWGVIDKNSWLQSQANVGGGTDGTRVQCPLLFDDFYKAKPSFWALADPGKLEPFIHPITLTESEDGTYTYGKTYSFENGAAKAAFTLVWNSNGISVQVKVEDANAEDTDAVTVYLEQDGAVKKQTVKRTDATASDGGYTAEVTFPFAGLKVGDNVRMDVVVTNGADKAAFNDLRFTQEESSKYFAKATVKPFAEISKGTAVVDGDEDAAWKNAVEIPLQIRIGAAASAKAKALWDSENLYIYMNVEDAVLNADNANGWEQDSVEVFIDENNGKTDGYEDDDKQYRISYKNEQSFNGTKCTAENLTSAAKVTANGYVVEAAFKWTDIKPAEGSLVGLEFQINDADSTGNRAGTISWYDESGNGWASPVVFGTVALGAAKENVQPEPTPAPQKKVKKPAKVTGLKKTKVTAVSAKISWKKAKNAKKYEVSYRIGKKKWKKVSTKKTSCTLKKLTKNTKIQVKVRGVNGKKKGAFSKVLKFKTLKLYSVQ